MRDGIGTDDYQALVDELTDGAGFDDIVMLDPRSAATVGAVAKHIARRGTLNLVGETALDGLVDIDVGRLHYDYTAYLGGRGRTSPPPTARRATAATCVHGARRSSWAPAARWARCTSSGPSSSPTAPARSSPRR